MNASSTAFVGRLYLVGEGGVKKEKVKARECYERAVKFKMDN